MATSQVGDIGPPSAAPRSALDTFLAVAAPNATVFVASLCIMAVELVAGRMIARHVGSSLYTWTAVIGVVLGGICIGNWIGGRLADKSPAKEVLGMLFSLASVTCLSLPGLSKIVGTWPFLWHQEWAVRIFSQVFLVFFLPSTLLGCIGPVGAKMALDLGRKVGRTVGSVYAWGALGSIVGTYLTGFYLIAKIGTIAVLISVAAGLALIAILFNTRQLFPYLWGGATLCFLWATMGPWPWAQRLGARLGVQPEAFANVLYVDESQYSYIQIEQESDPPSMRTLSLDHLIHAYIVLDDPDSLQYDYEKLYASVTETAAAGRKDLNALFIGGGGFVFPRYVLSKWPQSHVQVAEIDPRVTKADFEAFGLRADTPIQIHHLDARNHVDDLVRRKRRGEPVPPLDVIYGDAFNHYAVPYHLTTKEFNLKLRELMGPNGVYMINIIDIYESGLFLGAILNTFQETFPHVYAFSTIDKGPSKDADRRDTFVVVGSIQPLEGGGLKPGVAGAALQPEHMEELKRKSHGAVLTDDYAPVEQMLEPVVRRADKEG